MQKLTDSINRLLDSREIESVASAVSDAANAFLDILAAANVNCVMGIEIWDRINRKYEVAVFKNVSPLHTPGIIDMMGEVAIPEYIAVDDN